MNVIQQLFFNFVLENLWYEEEEQGLTEVAEDGNDCQRHPAEVTKRVAWKVLGINELA